MIVLHTYHVICSYLELKTCVKYWIVIEKHSTLYMVIVIIIIIIIIIIVTIIIIIIIYYYY